MPGLAEHQPAHTASSILAAIRRWPETATRALRYAASEATEYRRVSALFLRLLALVYVAAFASLAVQILGLVGSDGILPLSEYLANLSRAMGPERYWHIPTLFWLNSSDLALQAAPVVGCAFAILLFLNVLPRLCLVVTFVLYLSLLHAGQVFMNFQWDYLLVEAGFLAILLPGRSRILVWLLRWLLFRVRFLSGASKLVSGDPTWAGLTALNYYFETQPLPNPISWYVQQLPHWVLRTGTAATLFIELVVPFMILLPRPFRLFAAGATVLIQVLILVTSNHNFFNLLTIALCLFLLDDRALDWLLPRRRRAESDADATAPTPGIGKSLVLGGLGVLIVFVSCVEGWELLAQRHAPAWAAAVAGPVGATRLVNRYHVFPVINTQRLEVIIEGSRDGKHWREYSFDYQPGDPARRPPFVVPHQPRLDWMLWFVWDRDPMSLTWFERFGERLLENAPPVTALLAKNPFPGEPPRYLRITLYRYRFTTREERAATGDWWVRTEIEPFWPLAWFERPARG